MYLPAGKWQVALSLGSGAHPTMGIVLDDVSKFDGELDEPVDLGEVKDGWHSLRVTCGSEGPVELLGLSFSGPASGAGE